MEGRQEKYRFSHPQQDTAMEELVIQTPIRKEEYGIVEVNICQTDGLEDTSGDDSEQDAKLKDKNEKSSAESSMSEISEDSNNEESDTSDKDDIPKLKKRRKEKNAIKNNQETSSHK